MATRIVLRWIQLSAVVTACCLLIYLAVQQVWRHDANDPQIQMARDAAARLTAGQAATDVVGAVQPVDYARSLAPFLTVFDTRGAVVATSGRIRGESRTLPAGVLEHTRQTGEERVTWQPAPDARIASVVVAYSDGFVLAGRSLAESETRTAQMARLIGLAWLGMLAGLAATTAISEGLMPEKRNLGSARPLAG